jgi:rhodanese-related sulfurtransferase
MTASWLKQMGWSDVAVMHLDDVGGARATGQHRPRALGLERATAGTIGPAELKGRLDGTPVTVIDLDYSKSYRKGHIPGAWFSTRTRLGAALSKVSEAGSIVMTSPDGALARIAASEIAGGTAVPVLALDGGTWAWVAAGYPLTAGDTHLADAADDVWLPARERSGDREGMMRAYLAWEIDLVNQMATDDDQRFRVGTI